MGNLSNQQYKQNMLRTQSKHSIPSCKTILAQPRISISLRNSQKASKQQYGSIESPNEDGDAERQSNLEKCERKDKQNYDYNQQGSQLAKSKQGQKQIKPHYGQNRIKKFVIKQIINPQTHQESIKQTSSKNLYVKQHQNIKRLNHNRNNNQLIIIKRINFTGLKQTQIQTKLGLIQLKVTNSNSNFDNKLRNQLLINYYNLKCNIKYVKLTESFIQYGNQQKIIGQYYFDRNQQKQFQQQNSSALRQLCQYCVWVLEKIRISQGLPIYQKKQQNQYLFQEQSQQSSTILNSQYQNISTPKNKNTTKPYQNQFPSNLIHQYQTQKHQIKFQTSTKPIANITITQLQNNKYTNNLDNSINNQIHQKQQPIKLVFDQPNDLLIFINNDNLSVLLKEIVGTDGVNWIKQRVFEYYWEYYGDL